MSSFHFKFLLSRGFHQGLWVREIGQEFTRRVSRATSNLKLKSKEIIRKKKKLNTWRYRLLVMLDIRFNWVLPYSLEICWIEWARWAHSLVWMLRHMTCNVLDGVYSFSSEFSSRFHLDLIELEWTTVSSSSIDYCTNKQLIELTICKSADAIDW